MPVSSFSSNHALHATLASSTLLQQCLDGLYNLIQAVHLAAASHASFQQ
jgi:hypothetical protein